METMLDLDEAVSGLFNNTFPNCVPITKSIAQRTVTRFEQTCLVKNGQKYQKLQAMIRTSKFYDHL